MWRRMREFFLLTSFRSSLLWVVPLVLVVVMLALMVWWDHEPARFDTQAAAQAHAQAHNDHITTGYVTTATLIEVAQRLLEKRGGYLSNDVIPPSILMDNVPNWEFGVVTQIRDMARVLRNDISRSQTQSTEDADLSLADPKFHFDTDSWMFPRTENQYRDAIAATERYLERLSDPQVQDAQFYARADNLRDWLAIVEKRLGNLATRLAASVGDSRVNADLAGDPGATQSTPRPGEFLQKTPWYEIDDVFYEARGSTWALIHFFEAMAADFGPVLEDKNARASMENIIRALEHTQDPVWSPIILNGRGFGFTANHSLVMGSYVSRANAAVIELRNLLEQG